MRTPYAPSRGRRILCVFPEYAKSFGTFQHAYPFFGGRVRAFMPPQGLLVIAAYLPASSISRRGPVALCGRVWPITQLRKAPLKPCQWGWPLSWRRTEFTSTL